MFKAVRVLLVRVLIYDNSKVLASRDGSLLALVLNDSLNCPAVADLRQCIDGRRTSIFDVEQTSDVNAGCGIIMTASVSGLI